ncbi:tryptophan--tRNA ligase [Burkholderiaceae bacterium DAT-1]|nr:tryptophan--tRNA ligase [Burkholderiaceae bacterium DAT-1]
MFPDRVLTGMRPTGPLHLGHYHGALKNWTRLQHETACMFMVADWHALTLAYDDVKDVGKHVHELVLDWLAAGVDPAQSTIFIQSRVPEHAELTALLGMITPLSWLERVPTYRELLDRLSHKELDTYGFLGYPLMQVADILIYRATQVPIGDEQVAHIELSREIARRFNHLYGREPGFEEKAQSAVRKLGSKRAKLYDELRTAYQQEGDDEALESARALLADAQNLNMGDRERLFGYLEGRGKVILPEPQPLRGDIEYFPGLDGERMAKSVGNVILLRDEPEDVTRKVRGMQTDPARIRRTDPGEPAKCPVWRLHQIYVDGQTRDWVEQGCRSAGIGCLDCKQPLIDAIIAERRPMLERVAPYVDDAGMVKSIVADGCERARDLAQETMREVREVMGLDY